MTVGCVAAYLFSNHDDATPESLARVAFIRSQEQVKANKSGAILGVTLVRQVVAYPAYGSPGYSA